MSSPTTKRAGSSPAEDQPVTGIPCCPDLTKDNHCDTIRFSRVLTYPTTVLSPNQQRVSVEVILRFKFSRCNVGLTLGDPIYTTTLLPGEKVKLSTTDRRSRFTFDSETKLSYRSEQISEEQYYMTAFQSYMSDAAAAQSGHASSSDTGKWDFHGDAHGSIDILGLGADASTNASGSHNSSSISDYLNQQKAHVQSSASQSVNSTHRAYSVSVGEVSTRTHIEGESEDHFEASSREFSNPNACHAITFLFYRINKRQKISFELEAIEKRVIDNNAPIGGVLQQSAAASGVPIALVPQDLPATNLLKVNSPAAGASLLATAQARSFSSFAQNINPPLVSPATTFGIPLNEATRAAALKEVNAQLQEKGLVDQAGKVTPQTVQTISFEEEFSLPTGGVIVKGCLDDCNICEPEAREKLQLQNDLLRKQIEILEKSQEYRCCPPAPVIAD